MTHPWNPVSCRLLAWSHRSRFTSFGYPSPRSDDENKRPIICTPHPTISSVSHVCNANSKNYDTTYRCPFLSFSQLPHFHHPILLFRLHAFSTVLSFLVLLASCLRHLQFRPVTCQFHPSCIGITSIHARSCSYIPTKGTPPSDLYFIVNNVPRHPHPLLAH